MRRFTQVDVFTDELTRGSAVAVVHDADDLGDATMAAFARWTQLAETAFLLSPTEPGADYRLRIFTPGRELPFAGHPTLGSARAWLDAQPAPPHADEVVQQCGAGLVRLRASAAVPGRLAFAAPPLVRSGPVEAGDLAATCRAVRVPSEDVIDAAWVDNGPGWVALLLVDAGAVLAAEPDDAAPGGPSDIGLVGSLPAGGEADVEVRAFTRDTGPWVEDPVTGSLNAGVAQWLTGSGRLPARYVAAQGTRLGRRGRVHVERAGQDVWVGGDTVLGISGTVAL